MAGEIRLADFIEDLRAELAVAISRGTRSDIRFRANSIDLELKVVAEHKKDGSGKVSFSVLGIGAEGGGGLSSASQSTQLLKLSLSLVGKDGESVLISAQRASGDV